VTTCASNGENLLVQVSGKADRPISGIRRTCIQVARVRVTGASILIQV
jgi:hypothetical protein